MRNIQYIHETNPEKDIVILSINQKEDVEDVSTYIERHKMTFPVLLDRKGEVSEAYLEMSIPHSYFIDEDGVITSIYIGEMTRVKMEEQVKLAIK